jgi:general nucleoside transport system ATP-binding protein
VTLELRGITKRYGPTLACDGVDLELHPGEVLALLGENGAGKSTLMKVLAGVERADAGEIFDGGRRVHVDSPRAARRLGVGMVFQQFSSIPALSAAENLSLGDERLPPLLPLKSRAHAASLQKLREFLPELDPETRVADLAVGQKQLLELCKTLCRGARILVLDEPTSVLAEPDRERLWLRIRELARSGCSIVLITHKLDDVAACADRVVVMRAGKVVHQTRAVADRAALVGAMLGGDAPAITPHTRSAGSTRLSVRGASAELSGTHLYDVNLEVCAGEIVGVAGVTGNGQELLGRVLAGLAPAAGELTLDGSPLADKLGEIGYVPEQPLVNGCAGALSVLVNLAALDLKKQQFWLDGTEQRERGAELLERFDVRPRRLDRPAATLSGGNLQKLVIARELSREPALVVACFPTMGLDVAAMAAVIRELLAAAERGAAVVWISEDLDALLAHADRIAVLSHGRLRGPVPTRELERERLGAWMTGAAA